MSVERSTLGSADDDRDERESVEDGVEGDVEDSHCGPSVDGVGTMSTDPSCVEERFRVDRRRLEQLILGG